MKTHTLVVPVVTADNVTREQAIEALQGLIETGLTMYRDADFCDASGDDPHTLAIITQSTWEKPT